MAKLRFVFFILYCEARPFSSFTVQRRFWNMRESDRRTIGRSVNYL